MTCECRKLLVSRKNDFFHISGMLKPQKRNKRKLGQNGGGRKGREA
jgi:hypothetical protein